MEEPKVRGASLMYETSLAEEGYELSAELGIDGISIATVEEPPLLYRDMVMMVWKTDSRSC